MIDLETGDALPEIPARTVLDPVHFSDLKRMALSPAHFLASVTTARRPTPAMLAGTITHHIVCGPHRTKALVCYDGERKGNRWKDFAARTLKLNPRAEIVTEKEWEAAKPVAEAVLADPIARALFEGGRREVSLTWDEAGIACETDGIDLVGVGLIADLKRTSCTEPGGFARHAAKHWWHAQAVFYDHAARANGIDTSQGLYLIGVEPESPYCVTCMKLSPATIVAAEKTLCKWLETYRVCRDNDHWPGYTQTVVDFDLPDWMSDGDGEE